jgi:hypothetical protein
MKALLSKREGWRFESVIEYQYAKLTEAALGLVLKTMGTVMSRMGIDTSVRRQLTGVRGAIKPQNSSS